MVAEIKDLIESEMQIFLLEFLSNRKEHLAKKINAKGNLSASMSGDIDKQARADTVRLALAFNDYGRFIDMKRLKPVIPKKGSEYVYLIHKWLVSKRLETKFIRKYMKKYKIKFVTQNLMKRIVWGILIDRAKNKIYPKRWYNKYKTLKINDLYNQVVGKLPDKTREIILESFETI